MAVVVPIISTFDAKGIDKAIRDFKKLDSAGQRGAYALMNGTKAANTLGRTFAKVGAIGGGLAGVIGGSLVKAAYESQKVMKQTDAIIAATGGAAGITGEQVAKLSEKLSLQSGIDDELIQSSLNLLLTFKKVHNEAGIGNNVFDRTAQAVLDMGNVFGSTDAAAKQLGKALSDPVKGITALKKSGIDFTEAQKQQIKVLMDTGNLLGAQKLILKEVESQVGGTAAATATGFDRMRVALGNVAEELGDLLIPYVERFANFVINNLIPKLQQFADIVGKQGLGAGLKYLGEQGVKAIEGLDGFGALVYGVVSAVVALNVASAIYTTLTTASTIATAAFGITLNVALAGIPALIGLLVVGFVALMLKFKSFRDLMMPLFKNIGFAIQDFVNFAIAAINMFIRAYNGIPFLDGVKEIDKVTFAFNKTGKAAEVSASDFRKFEEGQKSLIPAILKTNKETTGVGNAVAGASEKLKTATDNFAKFETALGSANSASKTMADATKAVGKAQTDLASATAKVTAAQAKLNLIAGGYGASSKEVIGATKELARLQRDAIRAGYGLADAQQAVVDAQQKIADLNKAADPRTIQEATDDVTQANFRLADAQEELRLARIDGTQRQITEAEIAVRDATNDVTDANTRLADSQKLADPSVLKAAQDDLAIAELAVTDALDAQTTANENVAVAQQTVNDLTNGAATSSDTYRDALKELQDAQKEEVDALDNLTSAKEREFDATNKLTKANLLLQQSRSKLTAKQLKAANKAVDDLTYKPSAPVAPVGGMDFSNIDFGSVDLSGFDLSGIDLSGIMGNIPMMASGGVVTKPTLAMIGEGGQSEAVIPLDRMGDMGSTVFNITINSKIADAGLPDLLVAELRKFNRRSGAINIQVA